LPVRRAHVGQGTANRCERFEGAFLEILFAKDLAALRSEVVKPLGLDERQSYEFSPELPLLLRW
jgi:hypothetical protein